MKADSARDPLWPQLSELIARKTGLHFPPERCKDLQRGLTGAAEEFGFADATACAEWLLSTSLSRPQLHALASHLTVGETYFFRERRTFDALAESVLPELIRCRRSERHLRLWSAGCCTGEEAYSLAILLQQCIPDWRDWRITILATDINARFLQKAAAGVYGEWSFRDPGPGSREANFKERYFTRTADGRFAILPHVKRLVKFAPLNLAEDHFPSLASDTQAMDLIFCRNVLMYFTPVQARTVVENLRHALLDHGWLAVGQSECSHTLLSDFVPQNFPDSILYRKGNVTGRAAQPSLAAEAGELIGRNVYELSASQAPQTRDIAPLTAPLPDRADQIAASDDSAAAYALAVLLFEQGRYAEAAATLSESLAAQSAPSSQTFALLSRALANQGKLEEALAWCDRWIAANALDSAARYLRAVILQELGDLQSARGSLQHALYLDPDFVLAHVALGNLARASGKADEADRHFSNALERARSYPPEVLLPESDGLTAGRLTEMIASLLALRPVA